MIILTLGYRSNDLMEVPSTYEGLIVLKSWCNFRFLYVYLPCQEVCRDKLGRWIGKTLSTRLYRPYTAVG